MPYLRTGIFKGAAEEVFEYIGTEIPDMHKVIHRRSAGIEADAVFFQRLEGFFFADEVIIQSDVLHAYIVADRQKNSIMKGRLCGLPAKVVNCVNGIWQMVRIICGEYCSGAWEQKIKPLTKISVRGHLGHVNTVQP